MRRSGSWYFITARPGFQADRPIFFSAALHWFLESDFAAMQVPGTNTADPALSRLGALGANDHRVHHFVITDEHVSIGDQHGPCPQTRVWTTKQQRLHLREQVALWLAFHGLTFFKNFGTSRYLKVSTCINRHSAGWRTTTCTPGNLNVGSQPFVHTAFCGLVLSETRGNQYDWSRLQRSTADRRQSMLMSLSAMVVRIWARNHCH
ncbi:hypothetical protein GE09DRAFT_444233 [Coniochaeta sp. 2T2.1]|nr:hypothetical protein GE09DRAFT_444233 [Coniochaeta sp. 2T2.1]